MSFDNPYSTPNRYSSSDPSDNSPSFPGGQDDLKAPAIALLIAGSLGIAILVLNLVLTIAIVFSIVGQQNVQMGNQGATALLGLVMRIPSLILNILVVWGSICMLKRSSYGGAMTAAICALIPLVGPCCLLTIPFGIWALVLLGKPEVKMQFRSSH